MSRLRKNSVNSVHGSKNSREKGILIINFITHLIGGTQYFYFSLDCVYNKLHPNFQIVMQIVLKIVYEFYFKLISLC